MIAGLVIGAVIVYARTADALRAQLDASLATRARALALLVEYDAEDGLESELSPETAPGEYFELWAADHTSMLRSRSLGDAHLQGPDGTQLAYRDGVLAGGTRIRQVVYRFAPRQERAEEAVYAEQPLVTLAVASSTAALDHSLDQIATILFVTSALVAVLCLALLAWLVWVILRPVREVARSISAIDVDNLGSTDLGEVPTELRPISDRLGELLTRLERAFSRERDLTAEIAHELRTPLAGLRTTIEVALGKERTPERYRETLTECLAICAQTERTVQMLLTLSRLDANTVAPQTEPISLDDAVREAAARSGATRPIRTELAAQQVRADRDQLRVVLDNLLENAVAYADADTEIVVVVTDGPTLTVTNACGGITAEQAAHVFDRFWRADRARTVGHAGLGLALCKRLVELVGGTIGATVNNGRFVVTVTLPAG